MRIFCLRREISNFMVIFFFLSFFFYLSTCIDFCTTHETFVINTEYFTFNVQIMFWDTSDHCLLSDCASVACTIIVCLHNTLVICP